MYKNIGKAYHIFILGTGIVDNDPNPQVDRAFSKKIPRVGSAPSVKKINGTAIPS